MPGEIASQVKGSQVRVTPGEEEDGRRLSCVSMPR